MIMGPLFLVIGIGMIVYTGKRIWFWWRSRRWPRANGVVTRSEVRLDRNSDGHDNFAPNVEYSFEVEGRKFIGTALKFGFITETFGTRPKAEKRVSMFPVGAAVSVSYDPDRPDQCVLERKIDGGIFVLFVVGGLWAIFAARMIVEAFGG